MISSRTILLNKVSSILVENSGNTAPSDLLQDYVFQLLKQASHGISREDSNDDYAKIMGQVLNLFYHGNRNFTPSRSKVMTFLQPEFFYKLDITDLPCFLSSNTNEEFISQQKTIRILIDNAHGFGNQAATINLMKRLRLEFKGVFEVIYSAAQSIIPKLSYLLNIKPELLNSADYFDKTLNIRFIEMKTFIEYSKKNKNAYTTLGFTGGVDVDTPRGYLHLDAEIADPSSVFTDTISETTTPIF